jgi:hypothetical protein
MSYRSQVLIETTVPIDKELIQKGSPDYEKVIDGRYYYLWDSVNWSTYIDGLDAIETVVTNLDEDNYRFIRIGESTGDVEIYGYLDSIYTPITIIPNIEDITED